MTSFIFETGVKMINAIGKKAIPADQNELDAYLEQGYDIDPTGIQPKANVTPPKKTTTGKRHVSKAEARAISDANLAESLGMPSAIEKLGLGAKFDAKVLSFIEQPKKSGKGVFMSTQIESEGTKFCILYQDAHEVGNVLKCKLESSEREDGTFATRSKLTVTVEE